MWVMGKLHLIADGEPSMGHPTPPSPIFHESKEAAALRQRPPVRLAVMKPRTDALLMARCRKGRSGGARRLLQRRRDPLRLHHQLCNPTRHWITSFRLLETDSSLAQVCPSRQRHRRRNTLALAFCCGRVTDGLPRTRGSIIELDAFSLNPRTTARKTRGRRPCP